MAARVMRRILVDMARAHRNGKRGGGIPKVTIDETAAVWERPVELVALDEALLVLSRISPRQSQVVELHFFGGLTLDEAAEALHVSRDTVKRDWRFAKLWLLRELSRGLPHGD